MYKVKLLTCNFIDHFYDIKDFCRQAAIDNQADMVKKKRDLCQTTLNMSDDKWNKNPHSFLYRIYIARDFDKSGCLTLLYEDDKIIGISGLECSEFDLQIGYCGKRTYMLSGYRGHHSFTTLLLPEQIRFATEHDYKALFFTVNDYNDNIVRMMDRILNGRGILGLKNPEILKQFTRLEQKLFIKQTPQTVWMYLIDKDFELRIPENFIYGTH